MGEVYKSVGQQPLRFQAEQDGVITGVAQAVVVPARRGRHLAVHYGPVTGQSPEAAAVLLQALQTAGRDHACAFIRVSPFWPASNALEPVLRSSGGKSAPLHLLAEHVWYVPLQTPDSWAPSTFQLTNQPINPSLSPVTEESLLKAMRKTTRNLIGRAEREGVTIEASAHPTEDLRHFLKLHEETRRRHGFTPYTDAFFKAQVEHFAPRNECTLYLAHYQGDVIASSIHMHVGGETSYHHGASTAAHAKIPASYLLQWTAIRDALKRGDRLYNFWGVAPEGALHHPFLGVTTFKTGFGGTLLPLVHCVDFPLSATYQMTRAFEFVRKWRRGF